MQEHARKRFRSTYLAGIEACDVYIGLFWLGYGRYTVEEFEHARLHQKPCLLYVKNVNIEQRSPQLQRFLKQIQQVSNPNSLTVNSFATPEELVEKVPRDVILLLTTQFRQSRKQPVLQPQDIASSSQIVPRILSTTEQIELVDRLLACPAISDRRSHETVLDLLPREIVHTIRRSDVVRIDVINIVRACSLYSGGIDRLIGAVNTIEGNSLPMRQVDDFLRRVLHAPS